jgi:hypothetical protein
MRLLKIKKVFIYTNIKDLFSRKNLFNAYIILLVKLKKFIYKTLNTYINKNIIKYVLACNNLKIKNFNNIDFNKIVEIIKNESEIIKDKNNIYGKICKKYKLIY